MVGHITDAQIRGYRCVKLFPRYYSSHHICKSAIVNETGTVSVTRKFCIFTNAKVDTITNEVNAVKTMITHYRTSLQFTVQLGRHYVTRQSPPLPDTGTWMTTACLKQALSV
jgi:hypothetical protein